MRLLGSRFVFSLVNFFFIPDILEQKLFLRPASFLVFGFGAGGFKFMPCFLAEARPLAFKPPEGFLPSFFCHAGDLATRHPYEKKTVKAVTLVATDTTGSFTDRMPFDGMFTEWVSLA